MSVSHHGDNPEDQTRLYEMFDKQMSGNYLREFPEGRLSAEDDGAMVFAVAADRQHKRIIIQFPKPTKWIGLTPEDANEFINMLKDRVHELGEPVVVRAGHSRSVRITDGDKG